MSFYDAIRVGASGAGDFEVKRSLRFNGEGTHHYLQRTPSSAGNRQVCTFSCWTKRSNIGVNHCLASAYSANNNNDNISIILRSLSSGNCSLRVVGYFHNFRITNAAFRDPSAWLHVVVAIDTRQSSADDRIKVYINGVQETSFSTSGNVTQNMNLAFNDTSVHRIGTQSNQLSNTADGYIAEVNFIDGQQLTPASFAETNADTGQWVPIDTSGLTFGTNGYRLQFEDNTGTTATTLGKDTSGNGNNFTPNNFSVAAGVGNDSLEDTPSNNFSTLNSLALTATGANISSGNLDYKSDSNYSIAAGNFSLKTGKWYWEVTITAALSGGNGQINGIVRGTNPNGNAYVSYDTSGNVFGIGYVYNGSIQGTSPDGSTNSASGGSGLATFTNNDVLGFASDIANGTLAIYKNGSLQTTITSLNSHDWFPAVSGYGTTSTCSLNFGQRAFAHTPPTGHLALCSANLPDPTILLPNKHLDTLLYSGNGSQNRAISGLEFQPDWVWLKSRSNGYYHQLHDTVRGTAAGVLYSNRDDAEDSTYGLASFNNNGFTVYKDANNDAQNDSGQTYVAWNWNAGGSASKTYRVVVSSAGGSGNKYRFRNSANSATFAADAVTLDLEEGGTYIFNMDDSSNATHPFSIGTAANGTVYTSGITYFLDGVSKTYSQYTSGFSSASTRRLHITVPASAPQLYYWCSAHSGMGGAINTNSTFGSSNFDGSTQSTVKANTTAGFSIVLYTGQQNATDTIGHGLGVQPQVVISKSRNSTYTYTQWYVYHHKLTTNYFLFLNLTNAQGDGLGDYYVDASFSSTVFAVGDDIYGPNVSNNNYVAYCLSEVEGYSKFGSYKGNGSSNGTFVFLGFRPAWVMIKRTSGTQNWRIFDNKRNPFNDVDLNLQANTAGAEFESSAYNALDFLSNGFKLVGTNADEGTNQNGQSYIYLAFAESPFKNSRAR